MKEPLMYDHKKTIEIQKGIYNTKFTYFVDDTKSIILHNKYAGYTDYSEYLDEYISSYIVENNIYGDLLNKFKYLSNDELSYRYGYNINDSNRSDEYKKLLEKYSEYSKKLCKNLVWGGILEIPEINFCEWVYYLKREDKICDINGYELICDGGK